MTDEEREAELSARIKALREQMEPLIQERKAIRDRAKQQKERAWRDAHDERNRLAEIADLAREEKQDKALAEWGQAGKDTKRAKWAAHRIVGDIFNQTDNPLTPVAMRYYRDHDLAFPRWRIEGVPEEKRQAFLAIAARGGFTVSNA